MNKKTSYEKIETEVKWTISSDEFVANIEDNLIDTMAEFKYMRKKTQPPTMYKRNAGASAKYERFSI
jgi:hypothetical protein